MSSEPGRARYENHAGFEALRWRCPECRASARLTRGEEPALACDRGHSFGLVQGILTLCEATGYADSFGREWLAYARTQVDKFNGTTISRDRFFQYTEWPRDLGGDLVLEAGSGSGRFTQVLLDAGARVVSFDYSAAVQANAANNGDDPRLLLFRGDIMKLPFEPGSFDRVVCIGVLQHTPDPKRSFFSLVDMVRPGGWLAVDIYRLAPVAVLHHKYWVRPIRHVVSSDHLMDWVKRVVPLLLPIKAAVRKLPLVGVPLAHVFVPVPDYRGRLPLTDEQARIWAELDLFDMISPAHDHPITTGTMKRWMQEAGLTDVSVEVVSKGGQIAARGRKPT